MNLAGWTLAELLPLFLAGSAAITAMYLLRMRRRQLVVPFAALWRQVTRESDTRRLWRKLRRVLSWLLQLLLLALLCLALGDPRPSAWLRDPTTLAIVVDRSASMAGPASDGEPGTTRLELALRRARAELSALGPVDRALVITAGPEVAVPGPLGHDPDPLLRSIADLTPQAGEADLTRALALARSALAGQPGGRILVLTDGALDPAGIAKSLWPIFGISNQLLAVIAFCLGTVVLIKMGKARYCLVTVIPMIFLTLVTFTAGYMKIFSENAAGFLPTIRSLETKIAAGLEGSALAAAKTSLLNARIDIVITVTFLLFVSIIVLGTARECWLLLTKRKPIVLRESPYIAHPGDGEVLPTSLL